MNINGQLIHMHACLLFHYFHYVKNIEKSKNEMIVSTSPCFCFYEINLKTQEEEEEFLSSLFFISELELE